MTTHNLSQNLTARNGQPTKSEQFSAAFLPDNQQPNIDLPTFLTRRIVALGRVRMSAVSPVQKLFLQNQIVNLHRVLKAAMVNPVFRGGER